MDILNMLANDMEVGSEDDENEHSIEKRIVEWRRSNNAKFGYRAAFAAATGVKDSVPPEYLRKTVKDNGDLSAKRLKDQRKLCVGMLKYMPLALYKLLETVPMPWEETRYVDVVYHVGGLLTIVDDIPTVAEPLYTAQWGSTWTKMRTHKVEVQQEGGVFRRAVHKGNENEPPVDYGEYIMDRDPPPAVMDDLDPDDDAAVADWFYDPFPRLVSPSQIRGPRRRNGYFFSLEVLENLFRLASPILPQLDDKNYFYLWNLKAFYTAKAMHLAIPRAPKFDPSPSVRKMEAEDEDWTEFNDLHRVIHRDDPRKPRFTMLTERQIAFPFLYGSGIQGVVITPYHYPAEVRVENSDPAIQCFSFHPSLNLVRAVDRKVSNEAEILSSSPHVLRSTARAAAGYAVDYDDGEGSGMDMLALPDGFGPFLADVGLEDEHTKSAMTLLFAPPPFNTFEGGMKRRVDIPVMEHWCEEPPEFNTGDPRDKVLRSYTQILKHHVLVHLHKDPQRRGGRRQHLIDGSQPNTDEVVGIGNDRRLDQLAKIAFFDKTKVEWLEAGLQVLRQGHNMLVQLTNIKCLPYVHIDYNFEAKPTRTLTTKEIKKSRLGAAFHMIRELLGFIKQMIDMQVMYRLGLSDSLQLADAMHYLFTHVGRLSGLYRYKFRTMRQIKRTRDLKHLLYSKFNVGDVPSGPGTGVWGPSWRVWVFFLRGMTPLLQQYLGNLTDRLLNGRESKGKVDGKRITRQRIESDKDVNIKEAFRRELREMLPENVKSSVIRTMDQHMNEAFRHWRGHKVWRVPQMPKPLADLVHKYVKLRADEYIRIAHLQRRRIHEGDMVNKQAFIKNLGRLTRIKLMDEQERQSRYLEGKDPCMMLPEEATEIYRTMANWLSDRGFKKIPFPKPSRPSELLLLELSLNRLRDQHNIANRLTQMQREEQAHIEEAFNSPHDALSKIIDKLARQRRFSTVHVEYMDNFSSLYPIYTVQPKEKMIDSFLDQYLWYEAMDQQRLFPNWVKPSDMEPAPALLHKWCVGINNSPGIWDVSHDESVVLLQTELEDSFYDEVDWNLFRPLLELIMDKSLVDYIVSRHDVELEFKDMTHHHSKGLIRGFMFTPFLAQYWGLVIDILLLGRERSQEIAGPPKAPNPFMSFKNDSFLATSHPIRGYVRYNDTFYIVLKYTKSEADDVRKRYLQETKNDPELSAVNMSVYGFKNAKEWPRDARMRLFLNDVNLGRAVLWEFRGRLPPSIGDINNRNSFVSVYSKDNPNLLFEMAGFSMRLLPVSRTGDDFLESESTWNLQNAVTKDITARAFLQVSPRHVTLIRNKSRRAVMMVGNSTFQSIAAKWNALITEIVPYYREAILGTDGLQAILARAEHRMQSRVMMALNSRSKARFPPAMFYAPTDLGGLAMLSVGHSLIPAKDTVYSKMTSTGVQFFYSGLMNADDIPIPNVLQYYPSWETEIRESVKAWAEYSQRDRDAKEKNSRVTLDDIEDIIDKGIPRIRVRFSRFAKLYHFDKGFRLRMEYQKYQSGKYLKNWWFHTEHDGRICGSLEKYRADMNIALGGVETILEHSLFRGTGFPSWEGIEFNRAGGFENSKKDSKLAKQQRAGLTSVPNRRFALWWSPTINRADIQAGFESKIDTTGVFMCGKLETIKKSLIKLFSGSMWEKCHGAIVHDVASKLQSSVSDLDIGSVAIQHLHPQKSYTFTSSAADITLVGVARWPITTQPNLISDDEGMDVYRTYTTSKYWVDIQLRWGNYDSHNVAEYARRKFYEYSTAKMYPFPAGCVIAIDLAYNCFSGFGYWIPKLKPFLTKLLLTIMKHNIALNTLRDRMKKELQLFSSNPTEASLTTTNLSELFSEGMKTWIVDDSATYVTSKQPTSEGTQKFRSENGAVLVFEPISGKLLFTVVHKTVFSGQKRRTKLAREKAAEEIATWLGSTPASERPSKIIVTRSRFRQTLHNMIILDYPTITIGQSDLNLALPMILRHSRLASLRISATESKRWEFSAYDDWLQQFQPVTCFNLMQLILRGYHINLNRTREILVPDLHVEERPSCFWPTYTRAEWERVSVRLQEMIIADAARRMNISPNQFTEMEKKDILLGKRMDNLEEQDMEKKEIEQLKRTKLTEEKVVETKNSAGEVVKRKVKAAFDFGAAAAASNWRARSIADALLLNDSADIEILTMNATVHSDQLIFPRDTLLKYLECCDVQVQVCGYLFGQSVEESPNIKEVVCVMIPPQMGSSVDSNTPHRIPFQHEIFAANHLNLVGVIRTTGGEPILHSRDLAFQGRLLSLNPDLQPDGLCTAIIGVTENGLVMQCYTTTREGMEWAMANYETAMKQDATEVESQHSVPCRAMLSPDAQGFCVVPSDRVWNYVFKGAAWRESTEFDVAVDVPESFFSARHRPEHFLNFARMTEVEDVVDADDVENPSY